MELLNLKKENMNVKDYNTKCMKLLSILRGLSINEKGGRNLEDDQGLIHEIVGNQSSKIKAESDTHNKGNSN